VLSLRADDARANPAGRALPDATGTGSTGQFGWPGSFQATHDHSRHPSIQQPEEERCVTESRTG